MKPWVHQYLGNICLFLFLKKRHIQRCILPPGNFCFFLDEKMLYYLCYIQKLGKPWCYLPPNFSFFEVCFLFQHISLVLNTKTGKERNPYIKYIEEINKVLMFSNIISRVLHTTCIRLTAGRGLRRGKPGAEWNVILPPPHQRSVWLIFLPCKRSESSSDRKSP